MRITFTGLRYSGGAHNESASSAFAAIGLTDCLISLVYVTLAIRTFAAAPANHLAPPRTMLR